MFRRRSGQQSRREVQHPTPEESYYNTEEHFHEWPYRIGDRLPRGWSMMTYHAVRGISGPAVEIRGGWPSWGRPARVTGERACRDCRGRGMVLYAHVYEEGSGAD